MNQLKLHNLQFLVLVVKKIKKDYHILHDTFVCIIKLCFICLVFSCIYKFSNYFVSFCNCITCVKLALISPGTSQYIVIIFIK